jgi:GNAT superfamily N-acetyltransferase
MIPELRTATLEDAELIARLTRESWVGKPANSSGHFESVEMVEQSLREGHAIIMYLAGVPVGSVRWYPIMGESTPEVTYYGAIAWEIGRLGILPAYRGRGLSTWLMNEIMIRATSKGIEELRLAVRTDEPGLLEFYKRQGFFEDSSIKYSHANPKSQPPITMRKYLFQRAPSRGDFA